MKLLLFTAALAVLFAGGALAGAAAGPEPAAEPSGDHTETVEPAGHGGTAESGAEGGHGSPDPVRGLAVADGGLRLVVADPELRRGRTERLAFRIVDEDGATVRDFDVEHEKRMHLIVARRDLSGFQHLHPKQDAEGTWATRVKLPAAGSYRVFADFTRAGEAHTLAADLRVDGPADLAPLPAPRDSASSDGYDVQLDAADGELSFTITKDGAPVTTEPYLGAGGHLVALREGDLAFLHVHPEDDGVRFAVTYPTAGRYRLFLQFKHAGSVHTVAFTQEVR
jgi:hypothetical protein